jgi:hypothetical protein
MRTALAIDDDVMQAARVLARQQGSSLGAVISALARRALSTPSAPAAMGGQLRNGLPLLARSAPGGTGGSGACEHLAR